MRLTKEDRYGHFYTNKANCRNIWSLDGKKLEGEFFENQTLAIDGLAIDKLGQLEDIEDVLGIDLITLFKALSGEYAVKEDDGHISVEWSCPRFYAPALLNKYFDGFICIRNKENEKTLYLKDYGKTWALTKEELEHE